MLSRRTSLLVLLPLTLTACATSQTAQAPTPTAEPAAEQATFVPGELIIRVEDPALLTTEVLARGSGRDDLAVTSVECVLKSCRVVLQRTSGAADEAWTQDVARAVAAAKLEGVLSVELNSISHPR